LFVAFCFGKPVTTFPENALRSAPRLFGAAFFAAEQISADSGMPNGNRSIMVSAVLACVVAASMAGEASAAGDVSAGRHKALACQTCHGLDGKAKLPEAPNLAGQNAIYLVKALKDYRSGARKNDMMSLVAPTLKDQDIDDLAAYFSAIEVTVGSPPK
jgi:cytochrome c553